VDCSKTLALKLLVAVLRRKGVFILRDDFARAWSVEYDRVGLIIEEKFQGLKVAQHLVGVFVSARARPVVCSLVPENARLLMHVREIATQNVARRLVECSLHTCQHDILAMQLIADSEVRVRAQRDSTNGLTR
jgi:hypothetical protein